MARPRIIIADTDADYILSLQQKFIEEFFEKIDLEIITDRAFFEELFSVPQKAEILIVSEDLYTNLLQKHNISAIFVLAEQREVKESDGLEVNWIYKYSSVHKIFNEVVGKSGESLHVREDEKKETQIIVVTSAAGGVGKTTVAMGLSAALSMNYKRVLYINTDRMQTFQRLLQNPMPIMENDVYWELIHADKKIYSKIQHVIRKELFSYVPPFKAAMISLGIKADVFQKIAESAKCSGDYDYILIDADSSFDENKISLLGMADKVVLVTGQNVASVLATNILVTNVNGAEDEKYIFICNNFEPEKDNALISPEISLKFGIGEFIIHFTDYGEMKGTDFAEETSFRRAVYLLE